MQHLECQKQLTRRRLKVVLLSELFPCIMLILSERVILETGLIVEVTCFLAKR